MWDWTRTNLQSSDSLLSWLWRQGSIADPHTASDGNTDTALALLMAGRRWNDPALISAGTRMVRAVWAKEVVYVKGTPYLTAGDWATTGPIYALNPSYFSPYAYHVFQEVDPSGEWLRLVDSGYNVLFESAQLSLGEDHSAGLPPDWIGLDSRTGELAPLRLSKGVTTAYGYDAARLTWRIALDERWWQDGRAGAYLRLLSFLQDEVQRKGRVSAVYSHQGDVLEDNPSVVGSAGALAALLTLDPELAQRFYAEQFVAQAQYSNNGAYWGEPNDLYTQDWAWFSIALYADALPNLWNR